MSLDTQFLFDTPQKEIASLFRETIKSCQSLSIVTGFATVEGLKSILEEVRDSPMKLKTLVVGAGTYRGFEVMDELLACGLPENRLYIHLGFTHETGARAKHRFYRYHPMLHSKIYYFEMPNDTVVAFVGSHNLTGFALFGLNGEASVKAEGDINHPEIKKIRRHIELSQNQAVQYSPSMKQAYTWWNIQFIDGLRAKINDQKKEIENKNTVVILTTQTNNKTPQKGDVIYFELPTELYQLRSLNTEVHIYVFETSPTTSQMGLASLANAKATLWCRTSGLEVEQGGVELNTDWFIENRHKPVLERAPNPFRPNTPANMQQVRVTVKNEIWGSFEYLFDKEKTKWTPILDTEGAVQVQTQETTLLKSLDIVPNEHLQWHRVIDLDAQEDVKEDKALKDVLKMLSPQADSFILMSLRRGKS